MNEEISNEEIAELLARESMSNEYVAKMLDAVTSVDSLEDAISRSDVIDAIGSWYDSGIVSWKDYARDDLYCRIKKLPKVEPLINLSECWIPITDALPKDGIDVLLSYDSHLTDGRIIHQVCIAYYDGENKDWLTREESPEIISYPKAWMLLPYAFEESEEQV